jgi:hypothetical protein
MIITSFSFELIYDPSHGWFKVLTPSVEERIKLLDEQNPKGTWVYTISTFHDGWFSTLRGDSEYRYIGQTKYLLHRLEEHMIRRKIPRGKWTVLAGLYENRDLALMVEGFLIDCYWRAGAYLENNNSGRGVLPGYQSIANMAAFGDEHGSISNL